MAQTPTLTQILTDQQRDAFQRDGVLCLEGLLSADRVRRAREAVLRPLEQLGLWRDGAWRVEALPRPQWPASGLKTAKAIGNKHPELEGLIEEPALLEVVNALMDGRPFDRRVYKRPQVLFTLPNADAWFVPNGWHTDGPRLASGRAPGVQLFTFLGAVGPGGGGTVVVAGSHRLLDEGRFMRVREMRRLLRRDAFFRDLYDGTTTGAGGGLPTGVVDGVPLRVVELTGAPGDVWLVDLLALHAGAPNAADRPRLMATHRFLCADVVAEMAQAHGWGDG